jgi:ABC-type nitrate/sulfonate/bicarbonate transport system permease component
MLEPLAVDAAPRSSRAGHAVVSQLGWVVAIIAVFGLWEVLSTQVTPFHKTVPTPGEVLTQFRQDGPLFYLRLIRTTFQSALEGWLIGAALAIAAGLVCYQVRFLRELFVRVALVGYALPIIAIGPVLILSLSASTAVVLLAALPVVLVVLVGTLSGLYGEHGETWAVVAGAGGNERDHLRKRRLWYAVPGILAGLKIAAPTAFVSAIVGEFLAGRGGIGVALINAEQVFAVARVWSLTIAIALTSIAFYAVVSLAERLLVPWAGEVTLGSLWETTVQHEDRVRSRVTDLGVKFAVALVVALGLIGLWQALVSFSGAASLVARGPLEVLRYLTTDPSAATNRAQVLHPLLTTIRDAALGYLAGAALAVVLAALTSLFPRSTKGILSGAITVRTIPLVALTPLLIVVAGTGLRLIGVVGAVATFFPTFVYLVAGLSSAPQELVDVMHAAGAGPAAILRKVRLRASIPLIFASAKIAVPMAFTAALLAEWFGTGTGLGYLFATEVSQLQFTLVWAAVAAVTASAIIIYSLLEMIETATYRRFRL